jgi:hypothetical protein
MPRRDPAKEKYWRRLLRQWRHSALSGRDFCAEHGVSQPSFYAWRREIARRDQQRRAATQQHAGPVAQAASTTASSLAPQPFSSAATPTFVKLAVAANAPTSSAIEVVVAERRLLRVRPGFDADLLRQLVRLLEEPSC